MGWGFVSRQWLRPSACSLANLEWLVCLAVWACNDHGVAVRVFDPDLAMARTVALSFGRVAVRRLYDRCIELLGARYDVVEIGHFAEPQQDAITDLEIWIRKDSVVMFDLSLVELQDECVVGEQPLVVWASMITAEAKELLIPQARRFDVAYGDHGLGLSRTHPDDHADSIAGRIIDLDKPPLTAIELRAATHCAAAGLGLP